MALVIRTLYNNRNWMDRCESPYQDRLCYFCIDNKCHLNIDPPKLGDENCSGTCWEQILCKEYFWGCNPQGTFWGERAELGMKVFFVFRQYNRPKRLYALWAKTTISDIDEHIDTSGQKNKHGYHLMHFLPFKPAERSKWKWNLTANNIVGAPWGNGNYRYIGKNIESILDSLI